MYLFAYFLYKYQQIQKMQPISDCICILVLTGIELIEYSSSNEYNPHIFIKLLRKIIIVGKNYGVFWCNQVYCSHNIMYVPHYHLSLPGENSVSYGRLSANYKISSMVFSAMMKYWKNNLRETILPCHTLFLPKKNILLRFNGFYRTV